MANYMFQLGLETQANSASVPSVYYIQIKFKTD